MGHAPCTRVLISFAYLRALLIRTWLLGNFMNEESRDVYAMIAALVAGDRWLSADACAVYLGMLTPRGSPNRRGFLERVAFRPDFPKPNTVTRSWKKSEVDECAMNQKRLQ